MHGGMTRQNFSHMKKSKGFSIFRVKPPIFLEESVKYDFGKVGLGPREEKQNSQLPRRRRHFAFSRYFFEELPKETHFFFFLKTTVFLKFVYQRKPFFSSIPAPPPPWQRVRVGAN